MSNRKQFFEIRLSDCDFALAQSLKHQYFCFDKIFRYFTFVVLRYWMRIAELFEFILSGSRTRGSRPVTNERTKRRTRSYATFIRCFLNWTELCFHRWRAADPLAYTVAYSRHAASVCGVRLSRAALFASTLALLTFVARVFAGECIWESWATRATAALSECRCGRQMTFGQSVFRAVYAIAVFVEIRWTDGHTVSEAVVRDVCVCMVAACNDIWDNNATMDDIETFSKTLIVLSIFVFQECIRNALTVDHIQMVDFTFSDYAKTDSDAKS